MGTMGAIHHKAAIWVILVCIFLWAVFYQFSVGAVGFALGSEISSPPLRATTISFLGLTQCLVGWLIGFISPYLINPDAGNLGAKIGFIFAGMGVPLCILFWFFIPETMGLTYEDVSFTRHPPFHPLTT